VGRAGRRRLDVVLVERGLAPTRTGARALILAGRVRSAGQRLDKPGALLPPDAPLEVTPGRRYVSRGGYKLAAALATLGVDVRGSDALDVGASTGGFTQVLLEGGARRVVALDVGRGQLDATLRADPRVEVLEGVNARSLRAGDLPWRPDLAVVDVSFISLRLVLPGVASCLAPGGRIVALVKPQFEVGRGAVGRGGIVRDPEQHRRVLLELAEAARAAGLGLQAVCASALPGMEGNREYFFDLRPGTAGLAAGDAARAVDLAIAPPGQP